VQGFSFPTILGTLGTLLPPFLFDSVFRANYHSTEMIRHQPLPADIETRLPEAANYLESHPKVLFAYLFGGLARGKRRPLSDVDIAVWLTGTRNAANTKALRKYFDFQPRELNILKSKVIGHGR
jgi:predicted nucleotidyltransferase